MLAYVERLIRPTLIGPLREQWDAVRIAAATFQEEADQMETQADDLEAQATAKLAAGSDTAAKKLGTDAAKLKNKVIWPMQPHSGVFRSEKSPCIRLKRGGETDRTMPALLARRAAHSSDLCKCHPDQETTVNC